MIPDISSSSTTREREQFRVFPSRAGAHLASRIEQVEALYLLDDRPQTRAASVRVARQCSCDAQTICTGLLLINSPTLFGDGLRVVKVFEQLRPLDSAFNGDGAVFDVKVQDAIHAARVNKKIGVSELLAAQRVSASGNRHGLTGCSRRRNLRAQFRHIARFDDAGDPHGVELQMDVVDERSSFAIGNGGGVWRGNGQRPGNTPGNGKGERGRQKVAAVERRQAPSSAGECDEASRSGSSAGRRNQNAQNSV